MTPDAFERQARAFQKRSPFRPFVLELDGGTRIEVGHPEALVFRRGVAAHVSAAGVPTMIDPAAVTRVTDAREQTAA